MYIDLLVNITSRAWALPILASLHEKVLGRQAALLSATGAGRAAFGASMQHLIEIGLVERNPGHGHPLRPEFRLTQLGMSAAATAHKLYRAAGTEGHDLMRRSWTLPILTTLDTACHFNEVKRKLPKITDRALSQSLKLMEGQQWVQRRVISAKRPPQSVYSAINAGALISQTAGAEISFTV